MDTYDKDVLVVDEKVVEVEYVYDSESNPFEHSDGLDDLISGWTTRSKRPGERVLAKSHGSCMYFDWQAACKVAREKWGVAKGNVVQAVQATFDHLRGWMNDEWCYVGVIVKCEGEEDSLWAVDTCNDYHRTVAKEMAEGVVERVNRERRERAYWAARGVLTKEGWV